VLSISGSTADQVDLFGGSGFDEYIDGGNTFNDQDVNGFEITTP
jgi:hypothetical protein